MSKIQKLPQNILADITPYLVSDEKIEQALLQDNKKPNIIWLISTNQAIILYGLQPEQKPAIMIMPLDEIKEIDYLQKDDDIQVILYSGVNKSKAVFHFEPSAKDQVEKFFLAFGDLITYRFRNPEGKIEVVQRALPIGDKERHIFGRGKKLEQADSHLEAAKSKTIISAPPLKAETVPPTPAAIPPAKPSPAPVKIDKADNPAATVKIAPKIKEQPKSEPAQGVRADSELISQPSKEVKPEKKLEIKLQEKTPKAKTEPSITPNKTGISEKSLPTKAEEKEKDYGNPIYFIGVTIVATIIGFLCLAFYKSVSKIAKYLKSC